MNYIYDITLNFNNELYNFYEWNDKDSVELFLKIPVFKVEDNVINDLFFFKTKVSVDFINKIKNKSEIYNRKKKENYYAIFACEDKSIAIMFDKKGYSIKKSYLCIDEEEEVLEFINYIKYSLIDYNITEKNSIKQKFITRSEKEKKKDLLNKIRIIYKNKEFDKLKYIFYEIYNEKNEDNNIIYNKLINIIENNSNKVSKIDTIFNTIRI